MMTSVFVASQSRCFFLRSREKIGLVENTLTSKTFSTFSVANKWFHEVGQEFKRRCGLSPYDE
jgi:hypothetical protein